MLDLKESEVSGLDKFKRFDVNDWNDFSKRIGWKAVNHRIFDAREDAEDIIHVNSMDLTMMFTVSEFSYDPEERNSKDRAKLLYYPIKKQDIEKFDISESIIYESAKINMQDNGLRRIMKFSEYGLSDNALFPLMKMPEQKGMFGLAIGSDSGNGLIQEDDGLNHDNVLVVTSKYKSNGASYMFDWDTLDEVANRMNDSYYIAPISTDFLICIREKYLCDNGNKDISVAEDDLLDMVFTFNDKTPEEKILSYRIYHYIRDEKTLMSIKQQL